MPEFPTQIHPGPKEYKRLPGSIYVPLHIAQNTGPHAVGTTYIPSADGFDLIGRPDVLNGNTFTASVTPSGFTYYQAIPRLRAFIYKRGAAGSLEIVIQTRPNASATWVDQKSSGVLVTGNCSMFTESIFTKHIRIAQIITINTVTLEMDFGLLFGPE